MNSVTTSPGLLTSVRKEIFRKYFFHYYMKMKIAHCWLTSERRVVKQTGWIRFPSGDFRTALLYRTGADSRFVFYAAVLRFCHKALASCRPDYGMCGTQNTSLSLLVARLLWSRYKFMFLVFIHWNKARFWCFMQYSLEKALCMLQQCLSLQYNTNNNLS